jgi:hypothetical protein
MWVEGNDFLYAIQRDRLGMRQLPQQVICEMAVLLLKQFKFVNQAHSATRLEERRRSSSAS